MAMTADSKQVEAARQALQYPLVDALVHRRSRRFSLGAKLPGGGLAYESPHKPLPLSQLEEAFLAFAAAGINGFSLGDVPHDTGKLRESGGGNVMAAFTGRTGASADAIHSTALFVINDEGTSLLKRPQDFSLDDISSFRQMAADQRFEEAYDRLRVKIRDGRTSIPREVPFMFPFNKWSTNLAGSTYFLPVCDLTSMYINVILSAFDEQMAMFVVDDRNNFQPAGIKQFGQSKGGKLHDNPKDNRILPILELETVIVEFMLAEQAFMVHDLSLMEQAMGLGGWTHFASASPTAWFEALGFRLGSQRVSRRMQAGFLKTLLMRLTRQDMAVPYPLGFTAGGADLIKPFCPPYYSSMEAAVRAFLDFKQKNLFQAPLASYPGTWKDPKDVQGKMSRFSDECIAATIAYCNYVHKTYGRFPAYFGPLRTTLAHQAHHLDLGFYDTFYQQGAYTDTQAHHMEQWH